MSKKLYYRISPANDGIVFAVPDQAEFTDKIRRAFKESKTWGDFRSAMPPEEYVDVMETAFGELGEPAGLPSDGEAFDSDEISGYLEGIYPPWLQQDMDGVIPEKILEKYGEELSTMWQGDYVYLDEGCLPEILADLRAAGFEAIHRDDLEFF